MTDSEAKLIESMADDYSNVLKEAKSMGCKEIRALYNIPLKNIELIINALEKQIPKKPYKDNENGVYEKDHCPTCHRSLFPNDHHCECGQKIDWSDKKWNIM